MKLKLKDVQVYRCSKPACTHNARVERHHKGCEGMWVRHFARRASKKYLAYKARYEEFHPDDVVPICQPHHWEIHEILWVFIGRAVRKSGLHPRDWSWAQALKLIEDCRLLTNEWLTRQTPGSLVKPTRHQPSKLHDAKPR